jgi:hypothetical protein
MKTGLQMLASDVRFAQQMAFTDGKGVTVHIEPSNNRYYLKWSDGTYVQKPSGENFIVQLGHGEFGAVQITGTQFSSGRLDFDTKGYPLNNGTAFSGERTVAIFNSTTKLQVSGGTGLLKIEE